MQRESLRQQVNRQRNKRQLCEAASSPPQKWRRFITGSPGSSPVSSPGKGPLRGQDEDSPSFRARSFYKTKKQVHRTVKAGYL